MLQVYLQIPRQDNEISKIQSENGTFFLIMICQKLNAIFKTIVDCLSGIKSPDINCFCITQTEHDTNTNKYVCMFIHASQITPGR